MIKYLSKYQFHFISAGIIALVIGFLFHKPLTGEYTFGGPDSLSPSAVNQGITLAEEEYGKYPLWLPWLFSGLPSIHSFQNISDLYFPNVIIQCMKWMGLPGFWNYIFHFILAGMGVIMLLTQLGTSRLSALFGGLSFALMPYLITMVVHGHGSQMMTTAWLPWVIWAILKLYNKVNLTNIGILGLLVGLQLQRAHAQIAYYSWMASGLLILMLLWNIHSSQSNKPKWLIYTGIGLILGLCMAMWIYLPALNYAPHSIRGAGGGGGTGFEYATAWSFSFGEMSTFFIPSFYGFGGPSYWGNMPFTDYPNYMGIIVLTLAIIGVIFYEKKIKWFFMITAILALLISFGKHFFLYQIFYDYFPYFNKFRVPAMFLILTQFSVVVLAGLGLDISTKIISENNNNKSVKKLVYVVGGVLLIIFGLKLILGSEPDFGDRSHPVLNALRMDMINSDMMKSVLFLLLGGGVFYITRMGWIERQTLIGIMIAASVIDMAIVDNQIIEPNKESFRQSTLTKKSVRSAYLGKDEVIRFLKKDTTQYRILPLGRLANENRWAAFQIESVMGYHPAKLFRYNKVKDEVGWNSLGVMQMLNVKYVLTLEDLPHPAFEEVFNGNLYHNGKYVSAKVYKFKLALPRLFFAEHLEFVPKLTDQLSEYRQQRFDPKDPAIVEHSPQHIQPHPGANAVITYWSPDKIEINVNTPTDQFLILSEIYYPEGWDITSHPQWKIHPVNTILRGIYVPAGDHKIRMEFAPDDIRYGTFLTWGSTAILIIFIMTGMIIKRKVNESIAESI